MRIEYRKSAKCMYIFRYTLSKKEFVYTFPINTQQEKKGRAHLRTLRAMLSLRSAWVCVCARARACVVRVRVFVRVCRAATGDSSASVLCKMRGGVLALVEVTEHAIYKSVCLSVCWPACLPLLLADWHRRGAIWEQLEIRRCMHICIYIYIYIYIYIPVNDCESEDRF